MDLGFFYISILPKQKELTGLFINNSPVCLLQILFPEQCDQNFRQREESLLLVPKLLIDLITFESAKSYSLITVNPCACQEAFLQGLPSLWQGLHCLIKGILWLWAGLHNHSTHNIFTADLVFYPKKDFFLGVSHPCRHCVSSKEVCIEDSYSLLFHSFSLGKDSLQDGTRVLQIYEFMLTKYQDKVWNEKHFINHYLKSIKSI